ncbi:MAG: hypothetical protein HQL30_10140 [Candidatus Omnitrophica bacterium]|nr:hypothetical protein [Candidatus Omnitrophota bacterium]
MADKRELYRSLAVLGSVSMVPMVLGAGVFGGYAAGEFLIRSMGAPGFVMPLLVALGTLGSLFEGVRILKFALKASEKGKEQKGHKSI